MIYENIYILNLISLLLTFFEKLTNLCKLLLYANILFFFKVDKLEFTTK